MSKLKAKVLAVTVVSAQLFMVAEASAHAESVNVSSSSESVDSENLSSNDFFEASQQAARELKDSDLPRRVEEQDGATYYVYTLDDGREMGMPTKLTDPSPRVSAGPAAAGPWVEYTPLEQGMLATGAAVGISAAICAATAAVGCVLSSAMAAAATYYISERGVCPNERRLLIEYTWTGRVRGAQCR